MKRIIYIAIIILTVSSCGNNGKYDAQGTFEATEVVVSSEAAGRILSFDIEEGMPVKAGIVVGKIDSLQLLLQHKQLSAQLSALLDSRPDTKAQVAALREQIAKQKRELKRVGNMLKDAAATQKQYDDCCNEFLWVTPYVAKALWRDQMTGARVMLEIERIFDDADHILSLLAI